MTQTVQLLANNQVHVIAATPEQVAQLKPRIQLVQDGQYIVGFFIVNNRDVTNRIFALCFFVVLKHLCVFFFCFYVQQHIVLST